MNESLYNQYLAVLLERLCVVYITSNTIFCYFNCVPSVCTPTPRVRYRERTTNSSTKIANRMESSPGVSTARPYCITVAQVGLSWVSMTNSNVLATLARLGNNISQSQKYVRKPRSRGIDIYHSCLQALRYATSSAGL